MSLSAQNVVGNHRGVYFEVVGDGSTTQITVSLAHIPNRVGDETGTATIRTNPTGTAVHEAGKGGFYYPPGTNVPVSSASVSNGVLTVTTQSAITNGVRAYGVYVFDSESARN